MAASAIIVYGGPRKTINKTNLRSVDYGLIEIRQIFDSKAKCQQAAPHFGRFALLFSGEDCDPCCAYNNKWEEIMKNMKRDLIAAVAATALWFNGEARGVGRI